MTTLAIWSAVSGFAKRVPWQVWIAAAFVALLPLSYCKGKSDGKAVVIERLEKAQEKAKAEAEKAADNADANQVSETEKFEAVQDALQQEIDNAIATDANPLDAIF